MLADALPCASGGVNTFVNVPKNLSPLVRVNVKVPVPGNVPFAFGLVGSALPIPRKLKLPKILEPPPVDLKAIVGGGTDASGSDNPVWITLKVIESALVVVTAPTISSTAMVAVNTNLCSVVIELFLSCEGKLGAYRLAENGAIVSDSPTCPAVATSSRDGHR